eukprot:TRINITY_DN2622_c0_g1_i2.p1 TRINITY_DN2622_c0_g1~~TRINITY_DN2622_c0_g1_i2.p1  ORF type:complete len:226 (+),score=39.71 TRINITY_DN2622_c0_g1_i2:46-723(+)
MSTMSETFPEMSPLVQPSPLPSPYESHLGDSDYFDLGRAQLTPSFTPSFNPMPSFTEFTLTGKYYLSDGRRSPRSRSIFSPSPFLSSPLSDPASIFKAIPNIDDAPLSIPAAAHADNNIFVLCDAKSQKSYPDDSTCDMDSTMTCNGKKRKNGNITPEPEDAYSSHSSDPGSAMLPPYTPPHHAMSDYSNSESDCPSSPNSNSSPDLSAMSRAPSSNSNSPCTLR